MYHAAAGMDEGKFGACQHLGSARDLRLCCHYGIEMAITLRRDETLNLGFAIDNIFRHIDVYDARTSVIRNAKGAAHHFLNTAIRAGDAAPFGHGLDGADLIEILVRAAAIGVTDAGSSHAGDEQNAIAFAIFDGDAGKRIRHIRTVAGDGNAKLTGHARISAGHVQSASFMARTDQLDAEFFQIGIKAEVRAVDDAKNFFYPFICQHLRDDCTAGGLLHAAFLSVVEALQHGRHDYAQRVKEIQTHKQNLDLVFY